MKITIKSGTTSEPVASGSLCIKPGTSDNVSTVTFIKSDYQDNSFVLANSYNASLFDKAVEDYKKDYRYISTINGINGSDDGMFFVVGSMCDSVYTKTTENTTENTTLYITDLCPACKTCDKLVSIKNQIIYYKLWFSVLKDVNLYNDESIQANLELLKAHGMDYLGCVDENTKNEYFNDITLKGLNLLQQYITTVNMWNYVVRTADKKDTITAVDGDTAGFVVQTKRAVPSCDLTGGTISNKERPAILCSVTCSLDSIFSTGGTTTIADDNVSLCVDDAKFSYGPFSVDDPMPDPDITYATSTEDRPVVIVSARVKPTGKAQAGTYSLSFKVLPFINVALCGGTTPIADIRKYLTPNVYDGKTDLVAITGVPTKIADTESNDNRKTLYTQNRTYPSLSSEYTYRWKIDITWEFNGMDTGNNKAIYEDTETFYYECSGPRTFAGALLGPLGIQQGDATT